MFNLYSNKTFVIMYHKIEEHKEGLKGICVRPKTFDRQMKYLYSRGFRTIPFKQLVEILKTKSKIPKKVFVLTFDDGYENNYTDAFPILKKYNFTATIFLNAGAIGKHYEYPRSGPAQKHLSAEQITEMSELIDFGSHCITHPVLTQISFNEVLEEIKTSKTIIEKITKKPVDTFCYPYGEYDRNIVDTVKKYYSGACTTKSCLVSENTDPYLIPRIELKELRSMSFRDIKSMGTVLIIATKPRG